MKTVIIAFLIGWIFHEFADVLYQVIKKKQESKKRTVTLTKAEYDMWMRLMENEKAKAKAKTFGFSRALMEDKANEEDGAG